MTEIPFEKSFASHEKSKFWSDKNIKNPRDVFKSTADKYSFDCSVCDHPFDSALCKVVDGRWCPFCSSPPKKLCKKNECIKCFNNSFASHEKSKYWSDKNEKKPRDVFKSSHSKYWFDCDICKHPFDNALHVIVYGSWCPYCSNRQLCEKNECIKCFNNSFASHEKSKYWSDKNEKKPRYVFKSSHSKYSFDCDICKHSFDSVLHSIARGSWCPYCSSPPQKLCEKNECSSCFEKSFASHEKSKYWSKKNIKTPRDVFKSSNSKYSFDCDMCKHPFEISLCSIVFGSWCPYCKNKTEKKIYEILIVIYPTLIRQFKKQWCRRKKCLPFDFCIPEYKIIIELDGIQHFQQVSNWSSPEEEFENDKYKEKCANENGYLVIRILQEDVLYDKYDWLKELCDSVEKIINGYEKNIYLCKNEEYSCYTAACV
jgi:very-short-patch-repair endonuclease